MPKFYLSAVPASFVNRAILCRAYSADW